MANMEDVERARGLGWGWKEISKELGVESPQAIRKAYVRIKKRIDSGKLKVPGRDQQYSRKEVVPEKKKEAMPDAKAKTQKESMVFRSEDKATGGRIGPPKPIGRGRFELGKDIPDDEL